MPKQEMNEEITYGDPLPSPDIFTTAEPVVEATYRVGDILEGKRSTVEILSIDESRRKNKFYVRTSRGTEFFAGESYLSSIKK